MITDVVLALVLKIVSPLLGLLKPINIVVNSVYIDYVFDVVSSIMFFLPVDTINTILGIMISLWIFRVVIAFLRALWSILPIV